MVRGSLRNFDDCMTYAIESAASPINVNYSAASTEQVGFS
jgi:hypothetical protein